MQSLIEVSTFFFLLHDLQQHKLCQIFLTPLIFSSTEKAIYVCHTAAFPPTKCPETSLNIHLKAGEQWPGSRCPALLIFQWNSSTTAPTVQRKGWGLFWTVKSLRTFSCICFSVIKSVGSHLNLFQDGPRHRVFIKSLGQISNDHRGLGILLFRSGVWRKIFSLVDFLRIAKMSYTQYAFDFW